MRPLMQKAGIAARVPRPSGYCMSARTVSLGGVS